MTNYEVYFGSQARALDSLSMLIDCPDHPRKEVREFQKEVRDMGAHRWIKAECTNPRWWLGYMIKDMNGDVKWKM